MNAHLIVTIDTEEEGLWDGRFRVEGNTVENVLAVAQFQDVADWYGVRPTYLIDAPVVDDRRAVELLKSIQDDERGEIGAHLHPWCNPPLNGSTGVRSSYMCNLPEWLQHAKLSWLTTVIEEKVGRRPTSFRAGRYGLDIVGARLLVELGYVVDSSVIPFTDYSPGGGPDFTRAPHRPYYVGHDDLCTADEEGPLLEVPVSVGYSRPDFWRADALRNRAMRPWLQQFHAVGILDRLGIARRIKFSPEQADAKRLKQLVDAFLSLGAKAMVMMFHSSSLLPGHSPYVQTPLDLEVFYRTLEDVFHYCLKERGMRASTLTEFAETLKQATIQAGV